MELIPNGTFYREARVRQLDLRITRNFRRGNTRLQPQMDVYNFFNSDVPTAYNATYTPGPANTWRQPTTLLAPRFIRAQVQLNF